MRHKLEPDAALSPKLQAEIEKLKLMTDEEIDFSDIPRFTEEQLQKFTRVRPASRTAFKRAS